MQLQLRWVQAGAEGMAYASKCIDWSFAQQGLAILQHSLTRKRQCANSKARRRSAVLRISDSVGRVIRCRDKL